MSPTKIAIIGIGKIAQDQHLPVIAKNADFRLVGVVSQRGLGAPGVPTFKTPAELYAALPDLDAVAICTPPHVRHRIAREALAAGKHVMLEKPPAATVAEMHDLTASAAAARPRDLRHLAFAVQFRRRRGEEAARRPDAARARDRVEGGREALASRPGLDLGRRQFRRVRSRHQRALDPDQDRARRDVREVGAIALSRKSRHADRGLAGLLQQRRRGRRPADGRVRLAPGRRSELEHRYRNGAGEAASSDPRRLEAVRRRRKTGRCADGRIRGSLRAFRRSPRQGREPRWTRRRSSWSPTPSSSDRVAWSSRSTGDAAGNPRVLAGTGE